MIEQCPKLGSLTRSFALAALIVVGALAGPQSPWGAKPAFAYTITRLNYPGALSTLPAGINSAGTITGWYTNSLLAEYNFYNHGFLWTNGNFTDVDVPGGSMTTPVAINDSGAITGYYSEPETGRVFAFLRRADGTFTKINCPGSIPGLMTTYPVGIAPNGAVVGYYSDSFESCQSFLDCPPNSIGFIWGPDDSCFSFYAPGAEQTNPVGLTDSGEIAGNYNTGTSADAIYRGFLRGSDGSFTQLDVPPSIPTRDANLTVSAINASGEIAGTYWEDTYVLNHGFLRGSDGSFKSFNPPGEGNYSPIWVTAINEAGVITGYYYATSAKQGFWRGKDGMITEFEVPGAYAFTQPVAINATGVIVGTYGVLGANTSPYWTTSGFVLTP